jgi:hypothetical protein
MSILSVGGDRQVVSRDAATGAVLRILEDIKEPVNQLAPSPLGDSIALGLQNGGILLWDPVQDELRGEPLKHGSAITALCFSEDGSRLFSGGTDATLRIWDPGSGDEVLVLPVANAAPGDSIRSALFRPDDQTLLALVGLRNVHSWSAHPPDVQRLLTSARARRRMQETVDGIIDELGLRDAVVDRIRSRSDLGEDDRRAALHLALTFREDPIRLNNRSWESAKQPDLDRPAYELALRQARRACELTRQEHEPYLRGTLGIAHYRVGQFEEAISELDRADQMARILSLGPIPENIAFRAMAEARLGQLATSRKTLEELRAVMRQEPYAGMEDARNALAEAEETIEEISE